ncbi:MAG: biotin--[acetyl-CoA-carboxylase] ligase [Chloroflexota bacterium]
MLSDSILQQHLSQPFRYLPSVDSTNDVAQQWLRDGALAGNAIIADEQRAGRGRRGRTWYTPPAVALAVSIILKTQTQFASRASMVGALAVYDLCIHLDIPANDVVIKWPNDVLISGKKVSGILPEAVWQRDTLLGIVLGIGVNVRNQFTDDLAETATTLENATEKSLDRAILLAYLIDRVNHWSKYMATKTVPNTWRERLVTIGQDVTVTGSQLTIVGKAVDVEQDGTLLIQKSDGSIQRVMAGDVSLRPRN